jgi:NAD(P)-dependent dehydrogenase (short-subunit alcohol dehydrogenase family)
MFVPKNVRFDKLSDFEYHGSTAPPYASTRDLFSRYGLSKLANVLFSSALQKRHENIVCTSCNPGGTNTAGGMSVWPPFLRPVMSRLFVAPAVGARPVMLLAAGKEVAADRTKYKGVYVGSTCKIEPPSPLARDTDVAENLWKLSEEALAKWIKE